MAAISEVRDEKNESMPRFTTQVFLKPGGEMYLIGNRFTLGFGTDRSSTRSSRGRRLRITTREQDLVTKPRDGIDIVVPHAQSRAGIVDRFVPVTEGNADYGIGTDVTLTYVGKSTEGVLIEIGSATPVRPEPIPWNLSPRTVLNSLYQTKR